MHNKKVIFHVIVFCFSVCSARKIVGNKHRAGISHLSGKTVGNTHKAGISHFSGKVVGNTHRAGLSAKLRKEHPAFRKNQKHVLIPNGGTTVIQGTNYGVPAAPAAAAPYPASYPAPYPGSMGRCCSPSGASCCAQSQPQPPPCCLTLQPFGSHNMTVNAPSKVVLHINVLPGPGTAAPTTKAPTTGSTTKASPSTAAKTTGTKPASTTPKSTPPASTPAISTSTPGNEGPTPTSTTPYTTPREESDLLEDENAYKMQALGETNRLRRLHSRTPGSHLHFHDIGEKGRFHLLKLDQSLNIMAQRYANKLAASKKPLHSDPHSRLGQGENIAVECSHKDKPLDGKVATDMWYNEVKRYKWADPGYKPNTAHFTQLVWQGTKRVGFGRAKYINSKGQHCYVLVARYSPKGNIKGNFGENVLKGMYHGQVPLIIKG